MKENLKPQNKRHREDTKGAWDNSFHGIGHTDFNFQNKTDEKSPVKSDKDTNHQFGCLYHSYHKGRRRDT